MFLSYLNCITNHSLKKLLNLFRRSSSRSPPPIFRHPDIAQSSFSAEPPVPLLFPPAPTSRHITIVSRSAACACPVAIVGAARMSSLFFSHILFKSILFLSSNSFFSHTLFSPFSFSLSAGFLFLFLPCATLPCYLR
jgi:hypothetical protein